MVIYGRNYASSIGENDDGANITLDDGDASYDISSTTISYTGSENGDVVVSTSGGERYEVEYFPSQLGVNDIAQALDGKKDKTDLMIERGVDPP